MVHACLAWPAFPPKPQCSGLKSACSPAPFRQKEISAFIPQHYWEMTAHACTPDVSLDLRWNRSPCFDERCARRAVAACRAVDQISVLNGTCAARFIPPPVGLNTVALLKTASSALGLSPQRAMQV